MAMLNREIVAQDAALRQGNWSSGVFRTELRGRNLLVLGLGHIGAEVARWGNFYGMNVTGLTRNPSDTRRQELGLRAIGDLASLATFLPRADFVVVAIPHTAETTGFIGEAELNEMKSTAYLVNVARGPVVDERSLFLALRDKVIAGAANDVWYNYPQSLDEICQPATYPFHELPNIIMSPHNAGTTDGTMNYRFEFIAANIGRFYRGDPLQNVVSVTAS
jgi:phosphoglycerate dehydrogenase-like enzyme